MKKYLCLLTILLNTYGSDCETPNNVKERQDEIQKIIEDYQDKAQNKPYYWSFVQGWDELLKQFKDNPYSEKLAQKMGMQPLKLNNNTHTSHSVQRNETSCADICIMESGVENTLNCPVAHTCSMNFGIRSQMNCPLAVSCSQKGVINSSLNCPNAR
jgi:hypothetical protein